MCTRVIYRQHGFGKCVEQRTLVLEMPVERWLLHPEALSQSARR